LALAFCTGQPPSTAALGASPPAATFLRFAYGNHQALWNVELRYREGRGSNSDVAMVDRVALKPGFAIYD
jgi:hypothetical protein